MRELKPLRISVKDRAGRGATKSSPCSVFDRQSSRPVSGIAVRRISIPIPVSVSIAVPISVVIAVVIPVFVLHY